jgi:hypothetical protein
MTTFTAYQLAELFRKVDPHVGRHSGFDGIAGVLLDWDGHHLHAVATDRYTLAAAREASPSSDPAWAGMVRVGDLPAVTAFVGNVDGEKDVVVTLAGDRLTFTGNYGTIAVFPGAPGFPDWRGIIRGALEREPSESPFTGYTSDLFARWQAAGREICVWQSAFDKPLVVHGNRFIGLQMPRRIGDDESPAARYEQWQASLGTGEGIDQVETFNHWEDSELADRENAIPEAIEDLLKQVMRSTGGLFNHATGDPGALAAYSLAGGRAWLAFRLLKALEKADPDLLRATLADADDQLEAGDFSEIAWDEAATAGHDPQKWHDDYEAHLKALAAKRAAVAEQAPTT